MKTMTELRSSAAYAARYAAIAAAIVDTGWTPAAIRIQLEGDQRWWNANAYGPLFDYDDDERAEMLGEIDARRDALAKVAA